MEKNIYSRAKVSSALLDAMIFVGLVAMAILQYFGLAPTI